MSFGKGGVYMEYQSIIKLEPDRLHRLGIEFLKLKYEGKKPTVEKYYTDYLKVTDEINTLYSEINTKFINDSILNR